MAGLKGQHLLRTIEPPLGDFQPTVTAEDTYFAGDAVYTNVTKLSERGTDEMFAFRTDAAVIVIIPEDERGRETRLPE